MDTTRPTGAEPRPAGVLPTARAVPWRATAALAALLVLAGCSGSPTGGSSTGATASATPSASAVATPDPSVAASASSTLTPEEQQAFEEATATVLAYRQTIADLYSGARTNLNDLDKVATGDLLEAELRAVGAGLAQGYYSEPLGAEVLLVKAEAIELRVDANPNRVIVQACIDATGETRLAPDGSSNRGVREELSYDVVRTTYLPRPGWAVTGVTGEADPEDRAC